MVRVIISLKKFMKCDRKYQNVSIVQVSSHFVHFTAFKNNLLNTLIQIFMVWFSPYLRKFQQFPFIRYTFEKKYKTTESQNGHLVSSNPMIRIFYRHEVLAVLGGTKLCSKQTIEKFFRAVHGKSTKNLRRPLKWWFPPFFSSFFQKSGHGTFVPSCTQTSCKN